MVQAKYAELIYNGFWWAPERVAMQALLDSTQKFCAGAVRMKLHKGLASCVGRKSQYSLYNQQLSSFEDDEGLYDQTDAQGFIKLNALRLRTLGSVRGGTH